MSHSTQLRHLSRKRSRHLLRKRSRIRTTVPDGIRRNIYRMVAAGHQQEVAQLRNNYLWRKRMLADYRAGHFSPPLAAQYEYRFRRAGGQEAWVQSPLGLAMVCCRSAHTFQQKANPLPR